LGGFAISAQVLLLRQHSAEREMSASACTRSMAGSFYWPSARWTWVSCFPSGLLPPPVLLFLHVNLLDKWYRRFMGQRPSRQSINCVKALKELK